MTTMRAATANHYGSGEVIEIKDVTRPKCGPDEVLIAVRAASVNPYDWHKLTGTPLLMRLESGMKKPKCSLLGLDVAGVVESVGENVSQFSIGDEVFGCADGAYAEYVCAKETTLANKPANLSFEDAAAVPVSALTALQGLRNHGQVKPGQRILVNGASGGVGTYAVQLAKYLGADVTGVCSTKNIELVKSLGADKVVDYTNEDFSVNRNAYDLVLDNMGNRKIAHYKRCLSPTGAYVMIGAPKGHILGPLPHIVKSLMAFKMSRQRTVFFMAQQTHADLALFSELLASCTIRSVIDKTYSLDNIGEAFNHLETGHARGKIVVTIAQSHPSQ